jgi:hypothetical protein
MICEFELIYDNLSSHLINTLLTSAIMGRREQVLKTSCEELTQLGVECMWVQG